MKRLILLILIIVGSISTNAQDTIPEWPHISYERGFKQIDYPFLCVKEDTSAGHIKHCHVYLCYPHKMWVQINDGMAVKMGRKHVRDVWANHFTVTVTRKKYKHVYVF